MISSIDVAQTALNYAKKDVGQQSWDGRNITHWSTHVAMAAALIGAIILIIGIALDSTLLATLGGLLLVTNALSSYYLKKFSVFHSIDEVIQALSSTIKNLYDQTVGFHDQLVSLQNSREQFTAERKNMEDQLKKSQATIKELQEVAKKYTTTVKQLNNLTSIFQPLKKAVDEFIKKGTLLEGSEANFALLGNAVKELASERTRLEKGMTQLDDETEKLEKHEKTVRKQIDLLNRIMDQWMVQYQDVLEENKRSKREVTELKQQVDRLGQENTKIKNSIDQLEKLMKDLPDEKTLKGMIAQLKAKD